MDYRKDIQILRGLAVLLVVLFHVQAPGFASGFLGVDIFFVISGYLMALMYAPGRKAAFFGKRAARLLPAYFATILLTVLAAAVVTRPNDFSQAARQALFGLGFASNVGFWMENSYFDKSSFKPLLHLWSLGIEIQFYLLVPLLAAFFRRCQAGYVLTVLLSAGLCFLAVRLSPATAFFMLPLRLWEFLLGFGVARYLGAGWQAGGAGKSIASAAALLVLVALPLRALDGNAPGFAAGHPGLTALLVCLATAAVLALGLPAWLQANPVGNALERLGGYSYSIYLAHFPVIVLFLYEPFGGTVLKAPDTPSTLAVLALIAGCSAALFKLVEQPFRRQARAARFSVATAVAALVAVPLAYKAQAAFLPPQERLIYEAWFDRGDFRCGDFYSLLHRGDISCTLTPEAPPRARRVLFVGNSHADSIKDTFLSVARERRFSVLFVVQNTPLMEGGRVGLSDLVREAIDKKVEAVILHYSPGAVPPRTVEQLARRLAPYRITLSYLLPIPVWEHSVPRMLADNIRKGSPLPVVSAAAYGERNRAFIEAMEHIAAPHLRVYRSEHVFCKPVCRMRADDGRPYYFDDAHLTRTGSEQLRPVIARMLDDLPGSTAPVPAARVAPARSTMDDAGAR